jgi:molybdopterin-guanine dinucleotide biosynthesis adapter protein
MDDYRVIVHRAPSRFKPGELLHYRDGGGFMIPIVSIVGKSDVGKTTLLEKLVKELRDRGYRIATIKHDAHSFEIDHPGKDSWRHKQAGAAMTVISSREKLALVADTDHDLTLDEIRERFIEGVDLILSEGYKREIHPKIEVFRHEHRPEMLCTDDDNLVAVAGNPPNPPKHVPVFDLDEPQTLADFIEERFLKRS